MEDEITEIMEDFEESPTKGLPSPDPPKSALMPVSRADLVGGKEDKVDAPSAGSLRPIEPKKPLDSKTSLQPLSSKRSENALEPAKLVSKKHESNDDPLVSSPKTRVEVDPKSVEHESVAEDSDLVFFL